MSSKRFCSERGAIHIFGGIFALVSIYSTYMLLKEQLVTEHLADYIQYQKKQIAGLELRMQVLEFRHSKPAGK